MSGANNFNSVKFCEVTLSSNFNFKNWAVLDYRLIFKPDKFAYFFLIPCLHRLISVEDSMS